MIFSNLCFSLATFRFVELSEMPDNRQQHDTTLKSSSVKLMNKMILMHILIFITYQISSFRLLRLNIKLFWKTSQKKYDLSFNVHLDYYIR